MKTDWNCPGDPEGYTKYNCMAWTLGVTDREIWPSRWEYQEGCGPPMVGDCRFEALVNKYGCLGHPVGECDADRADIAVYGAARSQIAHVALRRRSVIQPEFAWESKLGRLAFRITHRLDDLVMGEVGSYVIGYLKFTRPASSSSSSAPKSAK